MLNKFLFPKKKVWSPRSSRSPIVSRSLVAIEMTDLTTVNADVLTGICNYLSPCTISRLIKTCKKMYHRLVTHGAVKRLCYDWLDHPRRGSLFKSADRKRSWTQCSKRDGVSSCSCVLNILGRFTGLEELSLSTGQAFLCLRQAAVMQAYRGFEWLTLPSLKSVTIVLADTFVRWMHVYGDLLIVPLVRLAPNLEQLVIAEPRCLTFKSPGAIPPYDFTKKAAIENFRFRQFVASIPPSIVRLVTPPLVVNSNDVAGVVRCATTFIVKWRPTSESIVSSFGSLQTLKIAISKKSVESFLLALDRDNARDSLASLRMLDLRFAMANPFLNKDDVVDVEVVDGAYRVVHDYASLPKSWPSSLPRSLEEVRLFNPPLFDVAHLPPLLHTLRIRYLPIHSPTEPLDLDGWEPPYLTRLALRQVSVKNVDLLPTSVTRLSVGNGRGLTLEQLRPLPRSCQVRHLALFGPVGEFRLLESAWPMALTSLSIRCEQSTPLSIIGVLPESLTSLAAEFEVPSPVTDWHSAFKNLSRSIKRLTIWNTRVDASLFAALHQSALESLVFDPCHLEAKRRALKCHMMTQHTILELLPSSLVEFVCPLSFKIDTNSPCPLKSLERLVITEHTEVSHAIVKYVCDNAPRLRELIVSSTASGDSEAIAKVVATSPLLTLRELS